MPGSKVLERTVKTFVRLGLFGLLGRGGPGLELNLMAFLSLIEFIFSFLIHFFTVHRFMLLNDGNEGARRRFSDTIIIKRPQPSENR